MPALNDHERRSFQHGSTLYGAARQLLPRPHIPPPPPVGDAYRAQTNPLQTADHPIRTAHRTRPVTGVRAQVPITCVRIRPLGNDWIRLTATGSRTVFGVALALDRSSWVGMSATPDPNDQ